MTLDMKVPPWVNERIAWWLDALSMREWRIEVGMSMAPNGVANCAGFSDAAPDLNFGSVTFRVDIEDNELGESYIVHELLHIKHSRIDNAIYILLAPHIGDVPVAVIDKVYRATVEPFIHSMAIAVVEVRRGAESVAAQPDEPDESAPVVIEEPITQMLKEQRRTNALLQVQAKLLIEAVNRETDVTELAMQLDQIVSDDIA